jgi:hypothetical protein
VQPGCHQDRVEQTTRFERRPGGGVQAFAREGEQIEISSAASDAVHGQGRGADDGEGNAPLNEAGRDVRRGSADQLLDAATGTPSALSLALKAFDGLLASQRWIVSQTERFQVALAERQREAHALVGRKSEDSLTVFSAQKISDASHRIRL